MVDKISAEVRSSIMSRIRNKDTRPEIAVRSLLHRLGYRFRLHRKSLQGCPDIVLPKYRAVVFVHGCFWHQHAGCPYSHVPKSNRTYWLPKLDRNSARDREANTKLKECGWRVLVIWECETKSKELLTEKISSFFNGGRQ